MAQLTKADAARQLGIARSTLYKLIDQGKLSPTPDGLIDQAELVRVAAYVDVVKGRLRTSADTHDTPAYTHAEYTHGRPQTADREQPETDVRGRPQTSSDVVVDILREQIQILRDELQEARQAAQERERDYREHIARLTLMLDQAHQQNQRLLDMPRQPPPLSPQEPLGASVATSRPARPPARPDTPQAPPAPQAGASRQAPPYDSRKFVLGRLCPRGHQYGTTGQSLLRLPSRNCPACVNAHKREQRARTRQQE